jgi:hypothetical protein
MLELLGKMLKPAHRLGNIPGGNTIKGPVLRIRIRWIRNSFASWIRIREFLITAQDPNYLSKILRHFQKKV